MFYGAADSPLRCSVAWTVPGVHAWSERRNTSGTDVAGRIVTVRGKATIYAQKIGTRAERKGVYVLLFHACGENSLQI